MPQKKACLKLFCISAEEDHPHLITRIHVHTHQRCFGIALSANLSCLVNLAPSPNFDFLYNYQVCVCVLVFTGLYELIHDNTTESKRTINILQRMNIYQKCSLAFCTEYFPSQVFNHFCFLCKIHLLGFCKNQLIFFPSCM